MKATQNRKPSAFGITCVKAEHHPSTPLEISKISEIVELAKTASAAFAPPAAILGLSYLFLKWISNAVCDNVYVST
jgi:hypothetical protein